MISPIKRGLMILGTAVALLIVACCSGCATKQAPAHATGEPVLAQCDQACYEPCVKPDSDTAIRWDGSPVDPKMWDKLAGIVDDSGDSVLKSLGVRLRQCEVHRQACTKCLDELERKHVITQ